MLLMRVNKVCSSGSILPEPGLNVTGEVRLGCFFGIVDSRNLESVMKCCPQGFEIPAGKETEGY